ncbi:helix-turn-helix domain-containing protein [Pigmentiphaga sp. NML080357]|uniref:helix-turn-helix domain-containing protein n=1 Tax=Pigmentiphaga sp. NML080357 TaxID=2008675 RepID=UPI001303098B|nr:helix-turn-helix domain-containing protein [Pigmentiphaga sp. NML080357]
MRGTIDCAILMVPDHIQWMLELVEDWSAARERIALHCVYLEAAGGAGSSPPAADALQRQALALKRYDACLLPVTLATLGWTRTVLAAARGALQTPVLGLVREMSAAGLQDLLSFGLDDFMRYPMCAEEFKTRLVQMAGPGGADRGERAECSAAIAGTAEEEEAADAATAPAEGEREAFQVAKARVVTEFERGYIAEMLARYQGNISQAARAASKNRRAFWQLMRKHEIAAEPYRRKERPILPRPSRPGSVHSANF